MKEEVRGSESAGATEEVSPLGTGTAAAKEDVGLLERFVEACPKEWEPKMDRTALTGNPAVFLWGVNRPYGHFDPTDDNASATGLIFLLDHLESMGKPVTLKRWADGYIAYTRIDDDLANIEEVGKTRIEAVTRAFIEAQVKCQGTTSEAKGSRMSKNKPGLPLPKSNEDREGDGKG